MMLFPALLAVVLMALSGGVVLYRPEATEAIDWSLLIGASLVMALTPGANQLLSLANGFRAGIATAMLATCGRFAAFIMMVAGVAAGLGQWLATSALLFGALKWIGVAYLLYLGACSLMTAWRPGAPAPDSIGANLSPWRLLRREALVALSNPKAYILFALFLPQFLQAGHESFTPAIMLIGLVYILVELACALVYAGAGRLLGWGNVGLRRQRWLDGVSGSAMMGLAGWLAFEKRPT